MKKIKKITILLLCTALFLIPFIQIGVSETTQGDTTFGVEEDNFFTWKATEGIPEIIGMKYNMTIEQIYVANYMSIDSYMIDCTLGFYNVTIGSWSTVIDNAFYVAANVTQDFIDFASVFVDPFYFLLPTPINLTMLGEYGLTAPYFENYTISGNSITFSAPLDIGSYELTYNDDGIMVKHVSTFFGMTMVVMRLVTGGEDIPFGFSFLIFTLLAIIGLVYLKKRKTK